MKQGIETHPEETHEGASSFSCVCPLRGSDGSAPFALENVHPDQREMLEQLIKSQIGLMTFVVWCPLRRPTAARSRPTPHAVNAFDGIVNVLRWSGAWATEHVGKHGLRVRWKLCAGSIGSSMILPRLLLSCAVQEGYTGARGRTVGQEQK